MVGGLVASVDTVGVLPSVTEYVGRGVLRGRMAAAVAVVVAVGHAFSPSRAERA